MVDGRWPANPNPTSSRRVSNRQRFPGIEHPTNELLMARFLYPNRSVEAPVASAAKAKPRLRRRRSWLRRLVLSGFMLGAAGTVALLGDAVSKGRLDPAHLGSPTRIYARPMVLQPGQRVDRSVVEKYLQRVGFEKISQSDVAAGQYRFTSRRWDIGRRSFRHLDRLERGGRATIHLSSNRQISRIVDDDGARLRYLALEPPLIQTSTSTANIDRVPVPLDQIPTHLVEAVLAVEDQRFYRHVGIDVRRIFGAAAANVRARRVTQGASTITQQLAKNLYLSPKRSPIRKLREAAIAMVLERRYTKSDILEAYLNEAYLGQNGRFAIHGVGRAAQFYFGKDITELDLADAALIAGIIRGPSLYAPRRHPERAVARRNLVLRIMLEHGYIDEERYDDAVDARLRLRDRPEPTRIARHFSDYVMREVAADGLADTRLGHAVFTTLDIELQEAAERAVREGLASIEAAYTPLTGKGSVLEAALVAIDPRTGEILAMVGGRDYGRSQFNRAVDARRQPGSAFKPIAALAALSEPSREVTLATVIDDAPLEVKTPAGLWQPVNYDERFRGRVTLREALERSLNVPLARLGVFIGPERIVETARLLGIEGPLTPVYSIALGSNEVTPLELTHAYGVFAAEGYRADLHSTLGVVDPNGKVHGLIETTGEYVVDETEAYLITSVLEGVVERGAGRRLRSMGFRGDVAAKSGTTNDFRDAGFVGYTPTIAIGVWVGFDDGTSIDLPGSRAALPIFGRFLVAAKGRYGDAEFHVPYGVEIVSINRESGLRAGSGCPGRPEVFIRGTAPRQSCSRYRWSRRWNSDDEDDEPEQLLELEALLRRRAGRH